MFRAALTDRLQAAFTAAGIVLPEGFSVSVELASDTRFGDYQSNAAMTLAKQLKTNPRALAEQIKAALPVDELCSEVSIAGPGFLNFRISPAALAGKVQAIVTGDGCDVVKVARPKTIVIDFSAPNIAKPMHVGHIRSTFIGDCLARVSRFVGHNVITDNHVGDWGTQFGMIIYGWKLERDDEALKENPIAELVRIYRRVNSAAKMDPDQLKGWTWKRGHTHYVYPDFGVLGECKKELVKLQQGDEENLGIWKECVRLTLDQLEKVYGSLDIQFDHYLGESFYNNALAPLVEDLLARGIATVSEGATVIFSDGKGDPKDDPFLVKEGDSWKPTPAIIRKSDGGFLYATTDLATINYRVQEWKADEIWYVVGAPQQLHFRQVFDAAKRMGHATKMTHIAFGSILGPDGKMFKTRSGENVGLIEVLDEAVLKSQARIMMMPEKLNVEPLLLVTLRAVKKYPSKYQTKEEIMENTMRLVKRRLREIWSIALSCDRSQKPANEDDIAKTTVDAAQAVAAMQMTIVEAKRDLMRALHKHFAELGNPDGEHPWCPPEKSYTDEEMFKIADIIGIGAVKYAELSQNRLTDYKFNWDKMLSLQGNTAPYLLNAYVRTRAIFRKLEGSEVTLTADVALTEPAEIALAMKLAQFAEATHDVLIDHRPNTLANYLYELANTYHSFYEACHVLNSEGTVRNTRLTLCEATSRVLKTGLGLLGIQTTERM